jgi:hypothetical protein
MVANGHIEETVKEITGNVEYAQRPLLFHNKGEGQFEEAGLHSGEAFKKPIVARGLAYADIDLDGDPDIILTTINGPPSLLRNDSKQKNNALRLILQGTKSNRSAIGTVAEAKVGTQTLRRTVRSGSSYFSQSELPVTLGLGKESKAAAITLRWPSGKVTQLENVAANRILTIDEVKGIIRQQPFSRHN